MRLSKTVERKCIVTGQVLSNEALLRFVLSPDCLVVCDISAVLPGRGVWVTAGKHYVERAVKGKMFHKAFGKKVTVAEDISDRIAVLLRQNCLALIGMARKSGQLVAGRGKVQEWLQQQKAGLLIIASDAADQDSDAEKETVKLFSREELSAVLGRENAVYVAVKKGDFVPKLLSAIRRFERYVNNGENGN